MKSGMKSGPESECQWYCRVCGADAPDFRPARGWNNRWAPSNVVALPCGHEQPLQPYSGLGWRAGEDS